MTFLKINDNEHGISEHYLCAIMRQLYMATSMNNQSSQSSGALWRLADCNRYERLVTKRILTGSMAMNHAELHCL
jgi:hypothetical protein